MMPCHYADTIDAEAARLSSAGLLPLFSFDAATADAILLIF